MTTIKEQEVSVDKSREDFENWAEEAGALPWGYLKRQRNPSDGYSVQIYTYMWAAWQASRKALVVELPTCYQYDDREVAGASSALNDCKEILHAAGITVKGDE